jgi:hypothetical protein
MLIGLFAMHAEFLVENLARMVPNHPNFFFFVSVVILLRRGVVNLERRMVVSLNRRTVVNLTGASTLLIFSRLFKVEKQTKSLVHHTLILAVIKLDLQPL